ncbi:MAG: class I SAM-dependent methyltransferase [archaeon]
MKYNLQTQYNGFTNKFIEGTDIHNKISRREYYSALETILFSQKKVLDVGCGDGYDIKKLLRKKAFMHGIDSSKNLVEKARKNNPNASIIEGNMECLPYEDSFFDVVLSKYVLQTSTNVPKVLAEMDRVLKPGGIITYLTVHPLRQFLEKKKHPKDYFKQEIVESIFFGGTVSAQEPTHTMNKYLNPEFLRNFRITYFKEHTDFPSSEKVDGDIYPCFFVLKAEKRM